MVQLPKREKPDYEKRVLVKVKKVDGSFQWRIGIRVLTDKVGDKYEFEGHNHDHARNVVDWQELPG